MNGDREKREEQEKSEVKSPTHAAHEWGTRPEVLDWCKAEIGKFYRPPKKPVTIRLDTDIIRRLKSYGRGYQTKTNMLLRHAMKSSVRAKANKRRSA